MCILFLALQQHADYPLIVASNRDEWHARPCAPMDHWDEPPGILAGRDLEKGGTWLGVNRGGRFAAVTNFRTGQPPRESADSRGQLVEMYLAGEISDDDFIVFLERNHRDYNPFNLVFGRTGALNTYCSEDGSLNRLAAGFHSISNGYLDQHWPKMQAGVDRIRELVEDSLDLDRLGAIMRDETRADEDRLPATGVDRDTEHRLSSIFIRGEDYGTRNTTVLLFTPGAVTAHETSYDAGARITGTRSFQVEFTA